MLNENNLEITSIEILLRRQQQFNDWVQEKAGCVSTKNVNSGTGVLTGWKCRETRRPISLVVTTSVRVCDTRSSVGCRGGMTGSSFVSVNVRACVFVCVFAEPCSA